MTDVPYRLRNHTRPITLEELHQHDEWGNCEELLDPKHKEMLDSGKMHRAGGDAECIVCGKIYYDHPRVVGALWLREACDDRLLKL